MTLSKRGKVWHYEFQYRGRRYRGSTGQADRDSAVLVESQLQARARQEAWGVAPPDRMRTPSFQGWAPQFIAEQRKHLKRPDFAISCVHVLLEFFGRAPATPRKTAAVPRAPSKAPYHDLRMLDPITDPDWIVKFETWMTKRGLSGSRKNHLRSTLSMMYRLALQPGWRKKTQITANPVAGIRRDRVRRRTRALTVDELRRWLAHAPYHLRVAMTVAILAPKLRLANILALKFGKQIDRELRAIVVREHKADRHAGALVVPLVVTTAAGEQSTMLREVLRAVRAYNSSAWVVEYQGGPVASVTTATRASAKSAGLTYGRAAPDGVTFHTIRHSMATLLATLPDLPERLRADVMGQTIQTAQGYTHLAAATQAAPHAAIGLAAPVADLLGVGGLLRGPALSDVPIPTEIRSVPRRVRRAPVARKSRRRKRLGSVG